MANALKNTPIPEDIVNFTETTDKGPVNAQQIEERNGRDSVMAKVSRCIMIETDLLHVRQRCCHSLVELG